MSDIVFYIGIDNREAYQKCMNLTTIDHNIHIGEKLESFKEVDEDIVVVCNGNIYNYKQLAEEHELGEVKNSDQLIIKLYQKYGILICSRLLYGEFSFILLKIKELPIYQKKFILDCYVVNGNLGVKPLFIGFSKDGRVCGVASREKLLEGMDVKPFPPGFYLSNLNEMVKYTQLFDQPVAVKRDPISVIINNVKLLVSNACKVRCSFGEKRIAFLLEENFNSRLVNKFMNNKTGRVNLFDDRYQLEVDEVGYIVKEVIEMINKCDVELVRRGVLLYLVARWMRKNSDYRVIICGEDVVGDEMIVCQKCFSRFGIEVRFPLVDQKVVKYLASVGDDHQLFRQVFTDVEGGELVVGEELTHLSAIKEYADKIVTDTGVGIDEALLYKNIYGEYLEKR